MKKFKILLLIFILSSFNVNKINIIQDAIVQDTIRKDSSKVDILKDDRDTLVNNYKVIHDKTIASYYDSKFNGRKTANGTIFSNHKLTAAHKTLPFGTLVKVTNIKNGKSVIVEINDRGPFIKGRSIDLSKKAFSQIANKDKGLIKVKVEILQQNIL